jgi:hypothetical protein
MAILHEKRERIKKKDQEELAAKAAPKAGGKQAPPAKGGAKAAAPATAPKVQASAPIEEEEAPVVILPKSQDHVNKEIKGFLDHFAASRKIIIGETAKTFRKRENEEKLKIYEDFN